MGKREKERQVIETDLFAAAAAAAATATATAIAIRFVFFVCFPLQVYANSNSKENE
ncbi:uncharacterized protein SOCG_02632 [Schizosaccharomyces octosporus yFS286]|uniref:Uncharacterized protein n=1 Tax=Schizosaccharomyces octosporus (strain yFS286) TaxID=483514 RepID=S9PZL2_SCHOY|nr:uncharacterized protein SOCG_02632 [Schizosaccharomyces octosporus yFS286]EPX73407.1 hypothetical protein SOCG_02632 [Schizosaccharomyces octosporus yFS286]